MMDQEEQLNTQPWIFEPIDLETDKASVASRLSVVTGAVGSLAARTETDFKPNLEQGYPTTSVFLHTPNGPVHFYRSAYEYHNIGMLGVEYPAQVGAVHEIVTDILQAEPATLTARYEGTLGAAPWRAEAASYRFPAAGESHLWVRDDETTVEDRFDDKSFVTTDAVLNGQPGILHIPHVRSLRLGQRDAYHYDEELPRKVDVASVLKYEERFKRLALAIGEYMGGVSELSAEINETTPGLLSFHSPGTNHGQMKQVVAGKFMRHGYHTTVRERKPNEAVDPGHSVITGHKQTSRGKETLAAYDGLSTSYYGRGFSEWRLIRGLALRGAVKFEDIDNMLRPLDMKPYNNGELGFRITRGNPSKSETSGDN